MVDRRAVTRGAGEPPPAKPCKVCAHAEVSALNKALLVIGQSPRSAARRYSSLTRRDIRTHKDVCLRDAVVEEPEGDDSFGA